MDECEAKPTGGLQAILQTALPCAEQGCSSKQQSHSQTAHKAQDLCSDFCPAPLLFRSTAVSVGTDQDLASDYSKTCLLTRGNSASYEPSLLLLTLEEVISPSGLSPPGSRAVVCFPLLLTSCAAAPGRHLWDDPRNLGFATDTGSCTHQEQTGVPGPLWWYKDLKKDFKMSQKPNPHMTGTSMAKDHCVLLVAVHFI